MKPCEHLSHYLDGRLERAGRDYFEAHLHVCPECQKVVNTWCGTKAGLKKEALERAKFLNPTPSEAARLVQQVDADRMSQTPWWNLRSYYPIAVTACISFALAGVLVVLIGSDTSSSASKPIAAMSAGILSNSVRYEATLNGNTLGRLGNDRFGLKPSSQLRVVSVDSRVTRLSLEKGAAAFSVASRTLGRQFVVDAGDYQVTVVGTKFSVDRREDDSVRVSVVEGRVEVEDETGRIWQISAGETLAVNRAGGDVMSATSEETTMVSWILGETVATGAAVASADAPGEHNAMVFDLPPDDDEAAAIGTNRIKPADKMDVKNAKKEKRPFSSASLARFVKGKSEHEIYMPDQNKGAKDNAASEIQAQQEFNSDKEPELALESALNGVPLWRQWILEGRLKEAEDALHMHLRNHTIDTEAMSLLADCRRKAGKFAEALETYKKLMRIAGAKQANRARFKAGVLMQEHLGNHFGAASIFEEYLASDYGAPLLRAKATVRLAKSLIVLGEKIRARQLLSRVMKNHGGTSAAIQARELLDRLN